MQIKASLLIGVLAFVSLAGIAFSLWTRHTLKQERAIVAHTTTELTNVYNQRDAIQEQKDSLVIELAYYKSIVDSLDVLVEDNYRQIADLNTSLERVRAEVSKFTPDEAYLFLQERYITEDNVYKYPFSGEQTKLIAADVKEGDYKDSLLLEYMDVALRLENQRSWDKFIIEALQDENIDLDEQLNLLLDDLETYIEEGEESNKEIARLKKALRMWQAGSIGAGAALALILLL